jgi:hypothetical protein
LSGHAHDTPSTTTAPQERRGAQLELFARPIWGDSDYDDPERLSDLVAARFFTMAGRCSGIPECCITAYVADAATPAAPLVGYRQCARCAAAGHVVKLRRCPPNRWHRCACGMAKDLLFQVPRAGRLAWLDLVEPELVAWAIRANAI